MKFPPISTQKYRKALKKLGLLYVRTKASHEQWNRPGTQLNRPIVFKTKEPEVDKFYQDSNLKTLNRSGIIMTDKEYLEFLRSV